MKRPETVDELPEHTEGKVQFLPAALRTVKIDVFFRRNDALDRFRMDSA